MKAHSSEHGQALVLILLAIVGLMGFAALAVDGGQVYAERRRSQSAADSAALAAARKGADISITAAEITAAGLDIASLNGFTNDGTTRVEIHNPPVSGPYSTTSDKNQYYQAIITTKVRPIFAQFVFGGDEWITTEAVVKADEISPFSGTNAIVGLNNTPGVDSIEYDGSVGINVVGGNIYSNSNTVINGASGNITIESGEFLVHNESTLHPDRCGEGTKVNPCPTDGAPELTVPNLVEPYCPPNAGAPYHETYPLTGPGQVNYYVWPTAGSVPRDLQPGIHCFYGGIALRGGDQLKGTGVVLVMKKGGIALTGSGGRNDVGTLAITRPNDLVDKNGNQVGGLVLYVSKDNYEIRHGVKEYASIMVGGNSDSQLNGTVYAPNSSCKIGGSSEANAFHTSIVCNEIKFHGSQNLFIDYDAAENVWTAPSLSVSQ